MDARERLFLLSSTDEPAQAVDPLQPTLLLCTASRAGEILLQVRCYRSNLGRVPRGASATPPPDLSRQ